MPVLETFRAALTGRPARYRTPRPPRHRRGAGPETQEANALVISERAILQATAAEASTRHAHIHRNARLRGSVACTTTW